MRSPVARLFPVAVCMLFVLLVTYGTDSLHVRSRLLYQVDFALHPVSHHQQTPLDGKASPSAKHAGTRIKMNCTADYPHLNGIMQRYGLDQRFEYLKRYVRFRRTEGLERKSMTRLSQRFLDGPLETMDLGRPLEAETACAEPLDVDVPASPFPQTVNASEFMFGVSTTYERFMDPETSPTSEWVYWLTDGHGSSNGGKLVLMLLKATDDELQGVADALGDAGIDADVYHSDASEEMAVRYLGLVPTLYTHPEAAGRKWLVTCDDDTYFPSMHGLAERMASLNHSAEMYVGTLSEDVGAVERHGSQAFGGAGVFLSLPLARRLTDLFGSCTTEAKVRATDTGWGPQGDMLLRNCIYQHTEARLTTVRELWQLDFFGDPSGFYESGMKPLSLHHYRGSGWHRAKPGEYTKVAYGCGEDCTLLRVQTADGFILSGYSVAQYPRGVDFNTAQVEGTFSAAPPDKGWNFDFTFGPRRRSLERSGRKMAWEMEESSVQADGTVLQTYIRLKDDDRWQNRDGTAMSEVDGILELIWIPW
ncbi:hypothetical protein ESCO_003377 [Escovopsis weberi]|uniref:Fringe-like glycosyltransferase domain-containing protein n=1 Tax=Escovopsis weberi TaxID=150374 RepID=A0A0M9VXG8_ESCWE|nr:hypothetical protein ESCO_003377 [Escovopsis weberi]